MTTVNGPARDQYLTALAKVIDSGAATSTQALSTAAQAVAQELAQTHNIPAQDLFELTPKHWLSDPTAYGAKKEAESLLAISGLLNVPMATVSPIATRGVQSAREMDLTILFNRSDAVKTNARPPEFLEQIDLTSTSPQDVKKKLDGLFAHPRFADLFGARNHRQLASFFDDAARQIAGVVAELQRNGAPGADVRAGGVPVSGPAYEAGLGVVGTLAELKPTMSLIALAYGGLRALMSKKGLSEAGLRSHILGQQNVAVCGRLPQDLLVLKGDTSGGKLQLVLGFDDAKVRQFQPTTLSKEDLGKALAAVGEAMQDFDLHADAMIPYGLIHDATARGSSVVAGRIDAEVKRRGATT